MTALFVRPLAFTVVSANEAAIAPAINANSDEVGMVWRSSNLTSVSVIIDLGASAVSYDTVAVVGSNLRAADTIQIRTGTTNTGTGNYAGSATAAYSGTKPDGFSTKSIYQIGTRTERYIRLDFVATSHPDTYVEAMRIVVGKAVTTLGIDYDAEQTFVDASVIEDGLGWTAVAYEGTVRPQWKVGLSKITDSEWRDNWIGFHTRAGKHKAILFVPDSSDAASFQADALFGRITSDASNKVTGFNYRVSTLQITALAP